MILTSRMKNGPKLPGSNKSGEIKSGQVRVYCKTCDRYSVRQFDGTGIYICFKCKEVQSTRQE